MPEKEIWHTVYCELCAAGTKRGLVKEIDGKHICEECFDKLQESDWIEVES